MRAAWGSSYATRPRQMLGLARPMQAGISSPSPSLMISPCLGQAPKAVPIALGAAFLATNAKVNESNAVRLRQGGAFGKLPRTV